MPPSALKAWLATLPSTVRAVSWPASMVLTVVVVPLAAVMAWPVTSPAGSMVYLVAATGVPVAEPPG